MFNGFHFENTKRISTTGNPLFAKNKRQVPSALNISTQGDLKNGVFVLNLFYIVFLKIMSLKNKKLSHQFSYITTIK